MSRKALAKLAMAAFLTASTFVTGPAELWACVNEQFVTVGGTIIATYSYCGGSCDLCIDQLDACDGECYSAWQDGIITQSEEIQCERSCNSGWHQCMQQCTP